MSEANALTRAAAQCTVASLFRARARVHPRRRAIVEAERVRTYAELDARTDRLAAALREAGVARGDRIAVLSENRSEYLEVFLAAAKVGAIVACQNWRLAAPELAHCVELVEPKLAFASDRFADRLGARPVVRFGAPYETLLGRALGATPAVDVDPEDPLLILYTSGTTGLPKGAAISHRAQIVRNLVVRAEYGIGSSDAFVAWSPMYHMGGTEYSLGTLMSGGTVFVVDGFDAERLAELVASEPIGWLLLMPGMIPAFVETLKARRVRARGVKLCGVMADLVPPDAIAEVTALLQAPYANTFGATETGNPPCSTNVIPIGVAPTRLSKEQSPYCEVKLVDADGREVEDGKPGELCMRGPTLFSGYFRADAVNAEDFRDGWFHMGDVFVRNADGTLDFVDRVKYLIKSGGENVYPAEIERVIREAPGVLEVAVVRRPDAKWGEVPVAFVARADESVRADALLQRCREALAGYKQPKAIHFVAEHEFPRSASGKVQRHLLEERAKV
jgi:acyl-CoA synthetase (AMP-forming)/AMP-acid ligase II